VTQQSLFDHLEGPPSPAPLAARADAPRPRRQPRSAAPPGDPEKDIFERREKDEARRTTIKRLRASGHWLTLLRVARTIPQPFTLNDISVAVWQACPGFFGMKGYPYPDNHKVHYILYGERGLIAKGLVLRVSQGLFQVPDSLTSEELQRLEQAEGEGAEAGAAEGGDD
jgi:hypothetical protein